MSKTLFFSLCLVALGLLSYGNGQMMCDFNPCQNNATCVVGMYGEPICYCAYGFSGQYCEDSVFCTEDFCLNGGICRSIPELQFKTCECVGNYLGPRCEFEIFSAELKGVEAGTNSPHIGYVAFGYFESDGVSRGASLIQIDLPDIVSAGIHMGPPGMNGPEILPFIVTNGTIEDLEMEVVPKFDLEALRNGGYYFVVRTLQYPQGEIRGQLGPWERECNLDCVNGFCYSMPFSPSTCECYPGYSGDLCEMDACSSSPCENNGTCIVGPYGFPICMCTDNYFGNYCELESCPPDACMNGGTCYPGPYGPTCVCPEGIYGQYCQISMYCQTNICSNGGTCYNGMYGPYCACPSGFFGYQCEQSNNCSPGVCMNGGTCYNGMYGPFCSCPSGFFGSHCEQSNECSSNVCKNGGTCYPGTYGPACICPSGYSGQYCDQTNSCTPGTCMNGGTCYPGPYGPSCACPSGFMGYYCEQKDKCHPNPCMNGGYCSYDIYSQPTCTCPPSYTGEFCQTQKTNSFCTPNFDIPFVLFESIPADGLIPSGDMIELVFTKDLDCSLTSVFFWVGYYSKMLCYGNKLTIKLGSVSPGANIFFMWSAVSLYGDVDESFSFYQIDYNPCDTQDFCNQRGECIYTFGEIHCECIPGFSGFNCSETTFSVNIEVQTCDMPNAGTFGPVILSGYSGSSNSPAMIINELAQGSASYFSAVYPMGGYFQPEGVHVYLGSQDSWCIESITLEMSLLPKITVPVNKWLTPTNFYTAVEFDFCSVNPCEFGGCESHPFTCTCPGAGIWTGEVCEDGNDCASNPCNAGNCTDLYFSYECTCPPEYLGANCESTNPCYGAPCTNGATCQVQGSSFVCNCPKGFSGDLCQTTIYDCQIHVLASVSAPTSANGLIKFNGNMGSTDYLSFGRFLTSGAIESRSATSSVNIGELMSIDVTSSKLTDAWGIESITCSAGNGSSKVFTIKNWISSANPNIHAE